MGLALWGKVGEITGSLRRPTCSLAFSFRDYDRHGMV